MEKIQAMRYIEKNKEKLFPNNLYSESDVEEAVLSVSQDFELAIDTIKYRDPGLMQIISVFPGVIGVDRFYLGDIVKGIIKYFTFGGLGIWWIIDIASAKSRCRTYNCKKLMDEIANHKKKQKNFKIEFDGNDINVYDVIERPKNDTLSNEATEQINEENKENTLSKIDKNKAITITKGALSIGKTIIKGISDINKTNYVK